MTSIGRPGRSCIGDAGAGSSCSRSLLSGAPGEGSQSFDVFVEQMRSVALDKATTSAPIARGADDALGDRSSCASVGAHPILGAPPLAAVAPRAVTARRRGFPSLSQGEAMTPVASQPPTSGEADPISLSAEEINSTKERMLGLLMELDACRNTALQNYNSLDEAQEQIDRLVYAGSAVLDYYASLHPPLARNILSDDRARQFRDEVLHAGDQCNMLAATTIRQVQGRRQLASTVLKSLLKSDATPDQLSRAASTVADHHVASMECWEKKAWRCERMRSVCAATANLPSATANMREADEAALRLHSGWALNTKVMQLESRVALAKFKIERQASSFEAPVMGTLMGDDGQVRRLGTFVSEVFPAFHSTSNAVLYSKGRPLDADHCAVLEGVVERLSEFAVALQDILTELSNDRTSAGLPLELLGKSVTDAWTSAHEVMRFLTLQPKTSAIIAPPTDAGAGISASTAGKGAGAEGTAARRKGKGKHKPATGDGSSARRPEPQVVAGVSDTEPAANVLVRSDLGTKKLVSAKEAQASAATATAHLAIWQTPASTAALTRGVERLSELLQFDLAGQQKTISQARWMKPEDAAYALDTVVERLQAQATEMEACLAALAEPLRLGLFTTQVRDVHAKKVRLQGMLSEARGLINDVNKRKAAITTDCMKTYPFPLQNYLEQLRVAKELTPADLPRALKGEPGALFEIKLQPKALRNGAMPKPMWVHIHTKRSVHAWQLATLDDADFAACHVKSNEQRGSNREWQDRRAALGHENVMIHRGKLTPAFCKSLFDYRA